MKMRINRRQKIIELISRNEISTQEALVELLTKNGYDVTQATVSRDVKKLGLVKTISESGLSVYSLPPKEKLNINDTSSIIKSGIISIDNAQNIVVVKCGAGLANAICVFLETLELPGVIGTLAGDDTIFIAASNSIIAVEIKEKINNFLF